MSRHSGIGMTSERTRKRMVDRLREAGVRDEVVLAALAAVPRHLFVEEALASRAYDDDALPIGHGQTISSPVAVARMTELLCGGRALGRVLEIGTGCGYQAAVLARVCREVYTLERIARFVTRARLRLRELKVTNVRVRHGDGHAGFPDAAPYDGILMTAAAAHVPQALLDQLAAGGRLVLPMGPGEQRLCVVERGPQGFVQTLMEEVRFVPLRMGVE